MERVDNQPTNQPSPPTDRPTDHRASRPTTEHVLWIRTDKAQHSAWGASPPHARTHARTHARALYEREMLYCDSPSVRSRHTVSGISSTHGSGRKDMCGNTCCSDSLPCVHVSQRILSCGVQIRSVLRRFWRKLAANYCTVGQSDLGLGVYVRVRCCCCVPSS